MSDSSSGSGSRQVSDSDKGVPVLRVENVSKSFGAIRALQDVSLEIRRGEIVGLVGDNGAGKSTLVKIIAGVHRPDVGRVYLDGEPVEIHSPAHALNLGIETVYQTLALVDTFDIAANFFLGRELTHGGPLRPFGLMRRREMLSQAHEAIRQLRIKIPGISEKVELMSGGQRQAVAIARAAFWRGKVLLLDEPTAALGVEESGEVMRLMSWMAREAGIPQLVISHNLEHIWKVCDRLVVLRQGCEMAQLNKDETTPDEVVRYITGAHVAA